MQYHLYIYENILFNGVFFLPVFGLETRTSWSPRRAFTHCATRSAYSLLSKEQQPGSVRQQGSTTARQQRMTTARETRRICTICQEK